MTSKSQVNRAGDTLRTSSVGSPDYERALQVAEDWRKAHAYPLKTFKSNLDKRLKKYSRAISAQRLKRMPTIIDKLKNRQTSMRLSAMQDIGGVRAVVKTVSQAEKLAKEYKTSKRFSHILKDSQCRNYIDSPKNDGYRGIHLVYEYNNTLARTQSAKESMGLLIEVQIRSDLQHIWATAVETVGLMTGESIKEHRGSDEWIEFFQYVSSAFAIVEDRNVLQIHKGKEQHEIYERVVTLIDDMKIFDRLSGYSAGLRVLDDSLKNHFYHLLILNTQEKNVRILGYSESEQQEAIKKYEEIESQHHAHIDTVLVSAGQRKELKKAYPNYYLDVRKFIEILEMIKVESRSLK